jgi:hypothetical protein
MRAKKLWQGLALAVLVGVGGAALLDDDGVDHDNGKGDAVAAIIKPNAPTLLAAN